LEFRLTLLYIEAEAQIDCFNGWGKARIDPGEVRDRIQGIRIVTMDTQSKPLPIGRERLMVIGIQKASRDAIETTFCHWLRAAWTALAEQLGAEARVRFQR
jgi:hypothetical protein